MKNPVRIAIFSTGVELPEIKKAVDILNYKTNEFDFKIFPYDKILKVVTEKEIREILDVPGVSIDGTTCTISEHSLPLYEKIREMLEKNYSYDYLIVVTPFNLFETQEEAKKSLGTFGSDIAGYFILDNNCEDNPEKTSIISVKNLDVFSHKARRKLSTSIVFLIISSLVSLLTTIEFEKCHLDYNKSTTSIGCLNDYCETLDEIVPSLMSLDFCNICKITLEKENNGKKLLKLSLEQRNIPWYYDQPKSFWTSLILIPFGIILLFAGNFENEPILNSIGTSSTVLGSFLLGLSRVIVQNRE
jgi:hypothetical protein